MPNSNFTATFQPLLEQLPGARQQLQQQVDAARESRLTTLQQAHDQGAKEFQQTLQTAKLSPTGKAIFQTQVTSDLHRQLEQAREEAKQLGAQILGDWDQAAGRFQARMKPLAKWKTKPLTDLLLKRANQARDQWERRQKEIAGRRESEWKGWETKARNALKSVVEQARLAMPQWAERWKKVEQDGEEQFKRTEREQMEQVSEQERAEKELAAAKQTQKERRARGEISVEPPAAISGGPPPPAADFDHLFREARAAIGPLTRGQWTDHNPSDPGITLLEILCFGLADLGYRLSFPLEDLLASWSGDFRRDLFPPETILPSRPISAADWRRALIAHRGVADAWLQPQEDGPAGAWRLDLRAEEGLDPAALNAYVQSQRNVGQVFAPVRLLPIQQVVIDLELEVEGTVETEVLVRDIRAALDGYIAPRAQRQTIQGQYGKGQAPPEFLEGPLVKWPGGGTDPWHLYPADQLSPVPRRSYLFRSEIIDAVNDLPGVRLTRRLDFKGPSLQQGWLLELDPKSIPQLGADSRVTLRRQGSQEGPLPIPALWLAEKPLRTDAPRTTMPGGTVRDTGQYQSLAEHFPDNYGINERGLPANASRARRAQAQQLRAYLYFFDQILANHFAQLEQVGSLFSFTTDDDTTEFTQSVPGTEDLWLADVQVESSKGLSNSQLRKLRFLDHLIARFGEDPSRIGLDTGPTVDLIRAKQEFLRDYPVISRDRSGGFDLARPYWGTEQLGGLERRIWRILGLPRPLKRSVTAADPLGFHLVEHILLAEPPPGSVFHAPLRSFLARLPDVWAPPNPYQYRITYLFPSFGRLWSAKGRVMRVLEEETPLQLKYHLAWLNAGEMADFERLWQGYLYELRMQDRS